MTDKVWSIEYEFDGLFYAMQIYGTEYEAKMHAQNLGLNEPELVLQNIHHYFIDRQHTTQ